MELYGKRVVLRPLAAGDRPLLSRWLADRELRRYTARRSPRQFPSRSPADHEFLILLRDGSRPIGICGLLGVRERSAQLGILLGERDAWGHGYGPEALGVLLRYAQGELGLSQISLFVHADNVRAIRAYAKVGFTIERRVSVGRWFLGRGREFLIMTWNAPVGVGR
ncbi:MAG: GNAT family N-acetyltransferase [Candidatus Bipolaricaulota bacterium]|nr:GNAT family N-acetyltransferase [Candidatus Bipolaricaulota bacterium]